VGNLLAIDDPIDTLGNSLNLASKNLILDLYVNGDTTIAVFYPAAGPNNTPHP
jgi:hypothetical protein